MNNIIYTFHIATILTLLLSGIFIGSVRGAKPPMTYLLLERFVSTFLVIVNIFQTAHTQIYGQLLWNPLHLMMLLSVYPFLFAYIFSMVRPGSITVRYWLYAFLPLAALAAIYLTFDALFGKLPLFSNYTEIRNYLKLPQLWILFAAVGFSIALISHYTVRAVGMLRQHRRNLESNFSYTEGTTLGWMWWAIAITLFKWLILMMRIMIEGKAGSLIGLFLFTVEPIVIAVLVLRQKDLYSKPVEGKGVVVEQDSDPSEWSSGKRKKLKHDLLVLLKKDEIFKDPELSIEKVREMLNTNRTYLWQVINHDMNTTFYRLINSYRLDKSLTMMNNPQHRNMQLKNIAEICGFKSLGAFSTLFKQTYGKTPTEWMGEIG
jgi:AraC-like DNA-binding protein